VLQNSDSYTFNGGINTGDIRKVCNSPPESRHILETVQDRLQLLCFINRIYESDLTVPLLMTFSNL